MSMLRAWPALVLHFVLFLGTALPAFGVGTVYDRIFQCQGWACFYSSYLTPLPYADSGVRRFDRD